MTISEDKARIRALLLAAPVAGDQGWGRAAEQLRRADAYRQAKQIYAGPAACLLQVRINALLDGKEVVMPGPGLRDGFYRLKPFVVPFKELAGAVTFRGLAKYGQRLPTAELATLRIELLLTDALAVDGEGGRLGRGTGFFDLACAIMADYRALTPGCVAYGVIAEQQLQAEPLPQEPWDVRLNGLVSRDNCRILTSAGTFPEIFWDAVAPRRIRKLQPLWEIFATRRWGEKSAPPAANFLKKV